MVVSLVSSLLSWSVSESSQLAYLRGLRACFIIFYHGEWWYSAVANCQNKPRHLGVEWPQNFNISMVEHNWYLSFFLHRQNFGLTFSPYRKCSISNISSHPKFSPRTVSVVSATKIRYEGWTFINFISRPACKHPLPTEKKPMFLENFAQLPMHYAILTAHISQYFFHIGLGYSNFSF